MKFFFARGTAHSGFTLVELLIVLAIVAILGSIAVPSYQAQTMKARRTDAKSALLGFAQAMERYFTENSTYTSAVGTDDFPDSSVYPSQAPLDGGTKYYNLQGRVGDDGTSYTLRATPISGGAQDGDGYLQISHTGVRAWDSDNSGGDTDSSENCWDESCS